MAAVSAILGWLRRPAVIRVGLGLFALYVLVLAGAAITVSTVEVRFGVRVWSDGKLSPGGTSGLRVATTDPENRRTWQGFEARGTLETLDGSVRRELFKAGTNFHGLSGTLSVPADFPTGPARLVVEAQRGDLSDTCVADVRVAPTHPQPAPRPVKPAKKRRDEEPRSVHVTLLPASGVLVPEMKQRLLVRTTGPDGAPTPGVAVDLVLRRGVMEGLPATVTTDAAGLAQLWVRPAFHDLLIGAGPAGEKPQDLPLVGKPAQFMAHLGPPTLRPGEPISLRIESMHGSGEVHADLWAGGRWVGASMGPLRSGEARAGLPPPGDHEEPILVQVYRHFAVPGKARYVARRLAADDVGAGLAALGRRLARRGVAPKWIGALDRGGLLADPPDRELLATWLLASWPDPPPEPPLLAETGPERKATAMAKRNRVRGRVIGALTATGVLVVLVVAYLLLFHVLRLERRYRDTPHDEDYASIRRARVWWEAGLMLFTIAVAIAGLILMLDGLTWGLDLHN